MDKGNLFIRGVFTALLNIYGGTSRKNKTYHKTIFAKSTSEMFHRIRNALLYMTKSFRKTNLQLK